MKKTEFLAQKDVQEFISWLIHTLPTTTFKLNVARSKFVPGGLQTTAKGIEDVLPNYKWATQWTASNGEKVTSLDWNSTKHSLSKLRSWLKDAVKTKNNDEALKACLAILEWGGVQGAIPFLHKLHSEVGLVDYLSELEPLMALNGDGVLEKLNSETVLRFDAGLTKIHALLDQSGSPIYDSRVGAAIAMFYASYCTENNKKPKAYLKFPSGSARGNQIRNPGKLGYKSAPQFFTKAVQREDWARWQVKLGWLLQATLQNTNWFSSEGSMPSRIHAFEACLFMLGYDLRNIAPATSTTNTQEESEMTQGNFSYVPAGHPFGGVVKCFATFKKTNPNGDNEEFRKFMQHNMGIAESTSQSYLFPIRENEFDLQSFDMQTIEIIAMGGKDGLIAAMKGKKFTLSAEREKVCLIDAWIAGYIKTIHKQPNDQKRSIRNAEFAGTDDAAATLIAVGKNVGKHFGLLDEDDNPTSWFHEFFGEEMKELQEKLV